MADKAILVVSFGTSFEDTRKKTIDRIEEDIQAAFPDYRVYRAWTSGMIIRKIRERDGINVDTVPEALERMLRDGVTELAVQPTHILNGIENDLMTEDVMGRAEEFEKVCFGAPLLTSTEDNFEVVKAVMEDFADLCEDEALVFMGHGTDHYANNVYAALDYIFKDLGYKNVFVGTVESYPGLENIMKLVSEAGYRKVRLAPFMVVAGDHATNDMAGDDPDSWKSRFEAAGCRVSCTVKGLGENSAVRKMYAEHVQKALSLA